MNRSIYSIALYLLAPVIFLYFAFRGLKSADYRDRFKERLGMGTLAQTDLLVHSVSMGETLAAIPLIRRIMEVSPQLTITVTTTSPTGSAEVRKAFGDRVQHCYLPLDFSCCISLFLGKIKPKYCMIMETELWPNLIHQLDARGAKIMLANARLSAKSAAQYGKRTGLITPMLQCLDVIAVQSAAEAKRFEELGMPANKINVCGSLKFDIRIDPNILVAATEMRNQWQKQSSPVWVAGSVHPGEFEAMLSAHKQLLNMDPNALLIMVPRHPEQFNLAAKQIESAGLRFVRRSTNEPVNDSTQVLLGDTMGELLSFYAAADQAFIGGTLVENGGHNPLEAAAMGLPVWVGPNHWNFAEITELLLNAGALKVVHHAEALGDGLKHKFQNEDQMQAAKEAGLGVVASNTGALDKQWRLYQQMSCGNA